MLSKLLRLLPSGVLDQVRSRPWLRQITTHLLYFMRRGKIASGVGKGLRFNCAGGTYHYLTGTADRLEQLFLKDYLEPGKVFYDIGANIGFFAVIAARLVGERGHVYAFEPLPLSAARLRANALSNRLTNLDVHQCALSDHSGTAEFAISDNPTNAHFVRPQEAGDTITVPISTLDAYISEHNLQPPSLIMIDVEGAEIEVLRGMRETLEKYLPTVLCEVHWIDQFPSKIRGLLPPGYAITTLDRGEIPQGTTRYHVVLWP